MIEATNPNVAWTTIGIRSMVNVFLCGVIVGVVTFIMYLLFERFVFGPIACNQALTLIQCDAAPSYASGTSIILGSLLGLVLLVRERVYRPMLAVLGIVVALWGVLTLLGSLPWFFAVFAAAVVFGLAYVVYAWVVQPTNFIIGVIGVVAITALSRLVLLA